MSYIDQLIKDAQAAKAAIPVHAFEMHDISELDEIKKAIYVIEEIGGDPEKTYKNMKAYKAQQQRACPKINHPSNVIYVGSSITGVKKRIKQHMGDGPKQTYALHLKHWFTGQYKITIKEYDVSKNVLQIIEDALSAQLKPAFGKSGANNK